MNILKRAIPSQFSPSSHPSRKWRFLLYSGTSYTLNPPKPSKRTQISAPTPSSSSSTYKVEPVKLADWPRPSEIPYQPKVANLVSIIGHIRAPVKFFTSLDGKYWAYTVIYQENSPEKSCLIPVLFEGDLAHVVTCHVKENDCVLVTGRLSDDLMSLVLSEIPGKFHLRVQNINFVQGFEKQRSRKKSGENLSSESDDIAMPSKEESKGDFSSEAGKGLGESAVSSRGENSRTSPKNVSPTKKGEDSGLDSWRDLVQHPREWWDYREQKSKGLVSNKYPDFKHKDTGAPLWLWNAPNWVLGGLESLEFDFPPPPKQKQVKDAKEDLWRSLAENPNDWWDNRLNKKNPKAPDFKHKITGEGLWLDKLPDWVLSKLPPMGEQQSVASGRNNF